MKTQHQTITQTNRYVYACEFCFYLHGTTGEQNQIERAPCTKQIFLIDLLLGAICSCTLSRASKIWFATLSNKPRSRRHNSSNNNQPHHVVSRTDAQSSTQNEHMSHHIALVKCEMMQCKCTWLLKKPPSTFNNGFVLLKTFECQSLQSLVAHLRTSSFEFRVQHTNIIMGATHRVNTTSS
jgi:hypothetical protein